MEWRDTWDVDAGEAHHDDDPDVDALAAEVSAEIAAAFRSDRANRQLVRDPTAAAAERGRRGYAPVRRPTVTASERRRKWLEEIAPLIADQASDLTEKVASLGLTPEEESLLDKAELWLRRSGPDGPVGQDA
jgi:hypothetical protein